MSGVVLSFSVALMWGISAICQKVYLRQVSIEMAMLISAVTLMVCVIVMTMLYPKEVFAHPISIRDTLLVAFASIVGIFFANLTLFRALKQYNVNTVISLSYVTPLIVLLLAYFILNEPISISAVLGTIMIILGAWLIVRK